MDREKYRKRVEKGKLPAQRRKLRGGGEGRCKLNSVTEEVVTTGTCHDRVCIATGKILHVGWKTPRGRVLCVGVSLSLVRKRT